MLKSFFLDLTFFFLQPDEIRRINVQLTEGEYSLLLFFSLQSFVCHFDRASSD